MTEYKIYFTGFACVEADSEEEANQAFWNDETSYEEYDIDEIVEI